jgi:hypothetical protein
VWKKRKKLPDGQWTKWSNEEADANAEDKGIAAAGCHACENRPKGPS